MDLSFLSRCTRSGHLIIIIWWWCSGDFMVGVCRESGRLIFCKLVLGASEYSPCAFHLQELCRVLCRVVEGRVTLPSQASFELLVPVHLHLHPNLQPHDPHQPLLYRSLLLLLLLHRNTKLLLHLLMQDHSTASSLGPCAIFFPPALAAAAVAGTPWMLSGLHRWAAADTPHAGTPHTHTTHPHPGRTAPQPCYN